MDKQILVYPYTGILPTKKRKEIFMHISNESQNNYAEGKTKTKKNMYYMVPLT